MPEKEKSEKRNLPEKTGIQQEIGGQQLKVYQTFYKYFYTA